MNIQEKYLNFQIKIPLKTFCISSIKPKVVSTRKNALCHEHSLKKKNKVKWQIGNYRSPTGIQLPWILEYNFVD